MANECDLCNRTTMGGELRATEWETVVLMYDEDEGMVVCPTCQDTLGVTKQTSFLDAIVNVLAAVVAERGV